ncbi:MAG TPA: DnaJ C-terminal domain-containing protein [Burkholderiaceae bacterium]|nr:DnaJ C-terminal domain-containing protein [Burkholderiaceae bacterium]
MSIDLAYAELGLSPGASESEVRAAWRRLASRWHPDRNKSAEAVALMQRINTAYETIRRASEGVVREAPSEDGGSEEAPRRKPDATPKRTVKRKVRLSLEEGAFGCTRVIRGRFSELCDTCSGEGIVKPDARCRACAGTGTIRRPAWFGWVSMARDCDACGGSGVLRHTCPDCKGKGRLTTAYSRTVRIPPGVRHGDVLNANGLSDGRGDLEGMLELLVHMTAHDLFTLDDDGTLSCRMPVDGFAWIANGWVQVPTLKGIQQMRLRRGRQVYRLRGQGFPLKRRSSERGDCIVTVVPAFPEMPGPEVQALLDRLAALCEGGQQGESAAVAAWRRQLRAWEEGRAQG